MPANFPEDTVRGTDHLNERLFSYVRPDTRIPADHSLWAIHKLCDAALARLSDRFDSLYSDNGRPSIAPEKLLRALLLQAFYSVRSERQLMEQMPTPRVCRQLATRWTSPPSSVPAPMRSS